MTEACKQWEGQVVSGGFRLCQYLGSSDHSAVFLTEQGDRELRRAAIKLIPVDRENAELQLSLWKLATKLSHPHLIRLFQMGRCHLDNFELLYVVMEYAEEDLSQILPHRPLTPTEGREMLEPVLDALEYVHRQGFVHGHMKPANIMAVDDQLKVSSDGLCRMGELRGGLGKPGLYDPPEKAGAGMSPAADVWSLGMTLVEALTQRLPVWEVTEGGQPVLPETVPAPFLDLARHCLDRDPQRRWTVAEIAARLKQVSRAPQEQAAPGPQEAFANWRYIVPTVAVGLGLAAAILAVPMLLLHRRPEAQQILSVQSEQSRVQPRPEQSRVVPRTEPSTEKTSDEKLSSSGPAPLSTPARSEAGASAPSGGLVRGEVLYRVLPDVPQSARDTIRGTVRVSVRVHVDPSGRVVGATFDSPGPSRYFANLASQAARRWEFAPAKVNRRYVSSEWILRFEFGRTATRVVPLEAAP